MKDNINVGDSVYILTGFDVVTFFFTQIHQDKVVDFDEEDGEKRMVFANYPPLDVSYLGDSVFTNITDAEASSKYAFNSNI